MSSLSLEIRAKIEDARDKFFREASNKFPLLFFPLVDASALSFISGAAFTRPITPTEKRSARVQLQIRDYTCQLFDIEAQYVYGRTYPLGLLGDLAKRVRKDLDKIVNEARLDVHYAFNERLVCVETAIQTRMGYWQAQGRALLYSSSIAAAPAEMAGVLSEISEAAVSTLIRPSAMPLPGAAIPAAPESNKVDIPHIETVRDRVDRLVVQEGISREEVAKRMKIARSTLYKVFDGYGKPSTNRQVKKYLDKHLDK